MGKVWLIASGKGGVGKSTLATMLGTALAHRGQNVCIVDMDIGLRSQDVLLSMQDRMVFDLMDVCEENCELDSALIPADDDDHLFLMTCPQFSRVKELNPKQVSRVIDQLRERFDHVLLDSPAGIERGLRQLMRCHPDEVLVVVTPDDVCIRDAERTIQVLSEKKLPRPRVLVNRLIPAYIEIGEMYTAASVAQTLDVQLLGEIPDDSGVYRAQLNHISILDVDCEARNAALRIAGRMMGESQPFPEYGKKRPWYQRFFHPTIGEVKRIDR